MFVIINISSKNYLALQICLKKIFNNELKHKLTVIESLNKKQTKKTKFSVLKSPHVNKTAQEQFEYKTHCVKLKCFVPQVFLFLIFLKKIKFNLFSDVNFKVTLSRNIDILNKFATKQINVNNYSIDFDELELIGYVRLLENLGKLILNSRKK